MTDYLDLMPKDILDMINKQVKDDYIKERRIQRKENRRQNREDKRKAFKRGILFENFVGLYRLFLVKKYMNKLEMFLEDYSTAKYEFVEKQIMKIFLDDARHEYKYAIIKLVFEDEIGVGGG
jgi:hypothetical protein